LPKITEYPELSAPNDNDLLVIEDLTAGNTKRITRENLLSGAPLPVDSVDAQAVQDNTITPDKLGLGATKATVLTAQTYASATLGDLATVGPTVTVTIGANGLALVSWGALIQCDSAHGRNYISVYMTGANTDSPGINSMRSLTHAFTGTASATTSDRTELFTGLTPGSTTFTLKYARSNGTTTFSNRHLQVIPL
jgi:hypothetical protein